MDRSMTIPTSNDSRQAAIAAGKTFLTRLTKAFNPSAAAVANESHTLFRGGGSPQADAIFDTGTTLQMQSLCDQIASAGNLYHGGNVGADGDDYKGLETAMANSAAATTCPAWLQLVDVLAWTRVTAVTTTTAQTIINSNTFTASSSSGLLLTFANDWQNFTKVRFTTTTTLPTGLSAGVDYWLVRVSATTARVATSFANAIAGTVIAYTDAGTGTHTLTMRLPRYSDGAGVQAIIFNPASTALGAGTPALTLDYTNSAGTASRATPTSPASPTGKTAATNSHILYTGATGTGKFGMFLPLAGADAGIQSVQTIRNSTSYVSGQYAMALVKPLGEAIPMQVLGQSVPWKFTGTPRVYDGAAIYGLQKSGVATPINSLVEVDLSFIWA
jgi:hypothetical protein